MKNNGQNSLIKNNVMLGRTLKEKRKAIKYPNMDNLFLKGKLSNIDFSNNNCLRNNECNILNNNFIDHNNDIRNNNNKDFTKLLNGYKEETNNLSIFKKKLFLKSKQYENLKDENFKRYKKNPDNYYSLYDKMFANKNIEKEFNLNKKNRGHNKEIDNKKGYSQFNSGNHASNKNNNDNIRENNKSREKSIINISSNFSKRNSKQNYKNGNEKITISKLDYQKPREKGKKMNINEIEEKNKFNNEYILSKEKKHSENEIKSLIEKVKIMKDYNQSLKNKIEKLEKENNNLKENFNFVNELKNTIKNKDNEIYELKLKEKELNELNNIIKNKDNEISTLEIKNKENISLLKERFIKINDLENINNEYKEKNIQLEKKIKEYEIEIEEINEKNDQDYFKLYGFINNGNNCYLNSSLQLLTRINEFKKGILSYQDNIEINKDTETKGKLFFEIKKIINEIENSDDDNLKIDPKHLKYVMGNIDAKYFRDFQEDANEFISNFISGLYKETVTKARIKDVKKLEIDNETEQKAYDTFYKRYYVKKGNSFLTEIFYGIQKTRNYCKNCGGTITNNFSSYNMLELPIYKLAKKSKNKTLELNKILDEYRAEKRIEFTCPYCQDNSKIYTETLLYTLPKYLMLSFIRIIGDEYIDNNIIYNKTLEIKNNYDNKNHKYILKCVIEHSGGVHFGHYTALCPKDKKNNIWYRFSDSSYYQSNNDFQSRNALILLYKSF